MNDDLRYPVGPHDVLAPAEEPQLREAIRDIAELPDRLAAAVAGLDDAQLATAYRPGGWTARQVVHHLADSHVNAYIRLRLALTEESPMVRAYDETRWAELPDAADADVAPSLALVRGLHDRWSRLLATLGPEAFRRSLRHPDHGALSVAQLTRLYGWHSRHHVAHITSLRRRMGW